MKNNEQPKKDAFEYEDDLLDGDTFYEAAIDKRKSRPNDDTSDSESIDENPEEIKLRQGKAYLERIMQQDSEESEGSDEDEDATMARLASDAVRGIGLPIPLGDCQCYVFYLVLLTLVIVCDC